MQQATRSMQHARYWLRHLSEPSSTMRSGAALPNADSAWRLIV
jgi:hypothetical protein